jgi:hypothetical protein
MRVAGIVLLVIGIIGLLLFGFQAINQSEAFRIFGIEIAVSSANWTPVIVSALITLVGAILMGTSRKSA